MNFKEILDTCKNLIDELDTDTQIDMILKSGVNKGYSDLCKIDKRVQVTYVPVVMGAAILPDDFDSIVKITPILTEDDLIVGNSIITDNTTQYTLVYSYMREAMVNDLDEPDLNLSLHSALINYGCYSYYKYKRKLEIANQYMGDIQEAKANFLNKDNFIEEGTGDYYAG